MSTDPMGKPAAMPSAAPVIGPGYDYASVTDKISSIVLTQRTSKGWLFGFAVSFALLLMMLYAITWLIGDRAWAFGGLKFRLPGASPSSILFGGSESATPAL